MGCNQKILLQDNTVDGWNTKIFDLTGYDVSDNKWLN